jgi:hypothetical protein
MQAENPENFAAQAPENSARGLQEIISVYQEIAWDFQRRLKNFLGAAQILQY